MHGFYKFNFQIAIQINVLTSLLSLKLSARPRSMVNASEPRIEEGDSVGLAAIL